MTDLPRVLILALMAIQVSSASAVGSKIIVGGSDNVCRAARDISRTISEDEYKLGTWRERFGANDWHHDTYPTITAEKRAWNAPFRHMSVDVNNDGVQDVVVVHSGTIRSVEFDWLYLFTTEQFQQAKLDGVIGKRLQAAPTLNPRNVVKFSNGSTAVPVELQIWHYKGIQYLLLKENFFPRQEPQTPNSLFVAKLAPTAQVWDEPSKLHRLVPELKCQLVAQ